jgi:mono/diheme cytochrome c family protein
MLRQTCLIFGFIGFFALGTSLFANAVEKGDPIKGKQIFAVKCVSCHGSTGKGDGPAAASFQPKPRSLSDAKYVSTLSDEHMFKTISEGGAAIGKAPLMPSFKSVLSEADIWNVIAYLRKDICKCEYKGKEKENK